LASTGIDARVPNSREQKIMKDDSFKWLIAGLAGALLSLCLIGGGAFFLVRVAMTELKNIDTGNGEAPEPSYGPDAWREKETEHNEKEAVKKAALDASGLAERYDIQSLHDDTRARLYEDQDFELVESRLTSQFAEADTPILKYRYSQHIQHIANLYYNEDPEALLAALNAWTDAHPDAHVAHLISGGFEINYAWYFRGDTFANQVTSEGWEGFHRHIEQAKIDLERANTLEPKDPESTALLATVAMASGMGHGVMRDYIKQTLAINPLHYNVRMTQINFDQPKWGGTWKAVERVIADCEANYEAFPLLAHVKRMAEYSMSSRGSAYEGTWNSEKTKWMMYEASLAQTKLSPDDLRTQANLASFASSIKRFDDASKALHHIGDRFPEGCRFGELTNYHRWRGIAYAEHAQDFEVRDTPREGELFDEALALDPTNTVVTGLYLAYLARKQDEALTGAYYGDLKDPYLATGSWGAPPNYKTMEAMAKASRSDDWGIQGTDEEKELLVDALALAPENALVRLIYAEHYITDKTYDKARVHLEKAREADPDYLPALHIMGWLNYHQKRWDDGIATAEAFLATAPSEYLSKNTDDALEIIELCKKKKKKAAEAR
jgi:tetratricopeptide (TPR) repeat protein